MTISTRTSPKKTRTSNIPLSFYTAKLLVSGLNDDQAGLFSDAFGADAVSFSCKKADGGWELFWTFGEGVTPEEDDLIRRLQIFAEALDAACDFSRITIEEMEDRNWLAESYQALPPLNIGSFFVYGSHYDGEVPAGKTPLLIEAATAFGSGEHGTTSACMLAIEQVKASGFNPRNILDMGCGSGILAAAAARLWPEIEVHAADNDPECVRVTNLHLASNEITNVRAYVSEGYEDGSPVWKDAPYDFIIANILAGPLIDMAPAQSRAVASGGYLILSGTLKEQADRVLAAYTPFGFTLAGEFPGNEWMTLLLRKA